VTGRTPTRSLVKSKVRERKLYQAVLALGLDKGEEIVVGRVLFWPGPENKTATFVGRLPQRYDRRS
jgi:hypothetical protein